MGNTPRSHPLEIHHHRIRPLGFSRERRVLVFARCSVVSAAGELVISIYIYIYTQSRDFIRVMLFIDVTLFRASRSLHKVFTGASTLGVWILRDRRAARGLPGPPFKAWNSVVAVFFINNVFLLVMPWLEL